MSRLIPGDKLGRVHAVRVQDLHHRLARLFEVDLAVGLELPRLHPRVADGFRYVILDLLDAAVGIGPGDDALEHEFLARGNLRGSQGSRLTRRAAALAAHQPPHLLELPPLLVLIRAVGVLVHALLQLVGEGVVGFRLLLLGGFVVVVVAAAVVVVVVGAAAAGGARASGSLLVGEHLAHVLEDLVRRFLLLRHLLLDADPQGPGEAAQTAVLRVLIGGGGAGQLADQTYPLPAMQRLDRRLRDAKALQDALRLGHGELTQIRVGARHRPWLNLGLRRDLILLGRLPADVVVKLTRLFPQTPARIEVEHRPSPDRRQELHRLVPRLQLQHELQVE